MKGLVRNRWLQLQELAIFPRRFTVTDPTEGASVAGLEKYWIDTEEGRVEAWLLAPTAPQTAPSPLVVFGHGNAELVDHWPELLRPYRDMGMYVLMPEYRGYGRSAGTPSEQKITADMLRFFDLVLAEHKDIDPTRIVYHGRSLGGGAVCCLARHRSPQAFVLQSTFANIPSIAKRWMVPRAWLRDHFENLQVLQSLNRPTLVFHGMKDWVVPFEHAEKIALLVPNATLVSYENTGHNDCPPVWGHFWNAIRRFLVSQALISDDVPSF